MLIDPAKEVNPKNQEVRSGFKSWSEVIRERGKNPRRVAEQIKKDQEMFDELKLELDSDNRNNSMLRDEGNTSGQESNQANQNQED